MHIINVTCTEYAAIAFYQAIQSLVTEFGATGGVNKLPTWGTLHNVYFENTAFHDTEMKCLTERTLSGIGGGTYTINSMAVDRTLTTRHGPVYRQVIDMSGNEIDQFIIPLGQSGNWLSPAYDNLSGMFAAGQYVPMMRRGYAIQDTLVLAATRQQ